MQTDPLDLRHLKTFDETKKAFNARPLAVLLSDEVIAWYRNHLTMNPQSDRRDAAGNWIFGGAVVQNTPDSEKGR